MSDMLANMVGLIVVSCVIVTLVSGTWLHWIAAGASCVVLGWTVEAMGK